MFQLDYRLSNAWSEKTLQADLATVDEMTLRYEVLLGDVICKAEDIDFSARWGWVPILDFAASVRQISEQLTTTDGIEANFDFTESNAEIFFKRRGNLILISSTYASGEIQVALTEFGTAVADFVSRVGKELSRLYPSLIQNPWFRRMFPTFSD